MNFRTFFRLYWQHLVLVLVLILLIPFSLLFVPSFGFPKGQLVVIPKNSGSDAIAIQLGELHVIRSPFLFEVLVRITGEDRTLESGPYVFDHPLGLVFVASRLANGQHGIKESRITLTEGMNNAEMADIIFKNLPGFNRSEFMQAASTSQGYLFPDTYFILPGTTSGEIVQRLRTNFDAKTVAIQKQISAFKHPLAEDVIVASILEKEVQSTKDRQIVAGIIYHRLAEGMPLQVDAAPETYTNKGLPAAPIANPGLDALAAAITPTQTKYVYYLTDKQGAVHYATTFAQHQANIQKYLK